jgi:hypothetical protein
MFCISKWPRGFIFIRSLSFLVAFGEVKETVLCTKHCSIKYCVGKENNVILVIQFSRHDPSTLLPLIFGSSLLQVFTVVKKQIGRASCRERVFQPV